jgi:hypothetical protein
MVRLTAYVALNNDTLVACDVEVMAASPAELTASSVAEPASGPGMPMA